MEQEQISMGVYNKDTDELEDFGTYENIEDALNDLLTFDFPRNRYGIIEGYGELRTKKDIKRLKQ